MSGRATRPDLEVGVGRQGVLEVGVGRQGVLVGGVIGADFDVVGRREERQLVGRRPAVAQVFLTGLTVVEL